MRVWSSLLRISLLSFALASSLDAKNDTDRQDHSKYPKNALLKAENSFQVDPKTFESRLSDFVESLSPFIKESAFDFRQFERHEPELKKELAAITDYYKASPAPIRKHSSHFRHARHMFELMTECSNHMKSAVSSPDRFHRIVSQLYEIRISAMMMLDAGGAPNTKLKGYSSKIARLAERMSKFGRENAMLLHSAPLPVVVFVWNQFSRTERMLEGLAREG